MKIKLIIFIMFLYILLLGCIANNIEKKEISKENESKNIINIEKANESKNIINIEKANESKNIINIEKANESKNEIGIIRINVIERTTVVWTNMESIGHSITSDLFDSGIISKGQTFSYTFNVSGNYGYYCKPHPFMKGRINVEI